MPKNRRRYYGAENSDPPPLWLPKGYIILAFATEDLAEALYPNDWNISSGDIDSYEGIINPISNGDLYQLKRERDRSRTMACYEAATLMLRSLHDGSIRSCLFAEGHDLKPVPMGFWNTNLSLKIIKERDITIDLIGLDFVPIRGVIVVNELDFKKFVREETATTPTIVSENDYLSDGELNYSPFITLMIKASRHFELINGRRPNGTRVLKKHIKDWLSDNWSDELGQKSDSSIESMATFIRHPRDGNGGIAKGITSKPALQITERKL